jgi:hypothetical protein
MSWLLRKLKSLTRRFTPAIGDMVHVYSPATGKDHYLLLNDLVNPGSYPEWNSTVAAAGGYDTGSRVTYALRLWESKIDDNQHVPSEGLYWTEVSSAPTQEKYGFQGKPFLLYTGDGLKFDVIWPDYYVPVNTLHAAGRTPPLAPLELDAADPTHPRIDVVGVDDTGGEFKITGTPSANPEEPTIDPNTQLKIGIVLVPAGATEPADTTVLKVYDENTETTNTSNNGTVNFEATALPFTGTKHIDCGAFTNLQFLQFVFASLKNRNDYNTIAFNVNLKAVFATNTGFALKFYNGATLVSSTVVVQHNTYNFNRTIINTYQVVIVPLSAFTFSNAQWDKLIIELRGSNGSGFRMDAITLYSNTPGGNETNSLRSIATDSGIASATQPGDNFQLRGETDQLQVTASGKIITVNANPLLDGVPTQGNTLKKLYDLITSVGELVGDHDASTGLPTTGSGIAGAIDKGDYWFITVPGTIVGLGDLAVGDVLFAKVNGADEASEFFFLPFASVGGGGHEIRVDDAAFTQRAKLDFIDAYAEDDAGNDKTKKYHVARSLMQFYLNTDSEEDIFIRDATIRKIVKGSAIDTLRYKINAGAFSSPLSFTGDTWTGTINITAGDKVIWRVSYNVGFNHGSFIYEHIRK